jgi:hypothetical protein
MDMTYENSHPGWRKDEEITINYGKKAFNECHCDDCVDELDITGEPPTKKKVKKKDSTD